ncbi:MAG: MFS transporter [Proteobacteria bacterium]|nr:MAG: MFS transporter [Pseudomonadota bacterium]
MLDKRLYCLTLGGFGIGLTEFIAMGLLPELSSTFSVTIPQAGYLISVYALGVIIGAPVFASLLNRVNQNRALVWLMLFFAVAHTATAFAPNFGMMIAARFLSGLPHGAFFGIGAVVAAKIAEEGKAGKAISVMFMGLALANVIGVPIGTYLGHIFSWRLVMIIIAVIGLLTALTVKLWIPDVPPDSGASLRKDLKIFKRLDIWLVLGLLCIGFGGFFAWISYINPLATQIAKFSITDMVWILVLVGIGMLIGNSLGAIIADRMKPATATRRILLLLVSLLLAGYFLSDYPVPFLILSLLLGGTAFMIIIPVQMLLVQAAKGSETLGSALGQAGFNVGNALGAFLGGIPLTMGYSFRSPQLVGVGLSLVGVILTSVIIKREKQTA